MKIFSIMNQKGGTGKTTTAAALIAGLKKKRYKVLGIELDPQRNLSYMFDAQENQTEFVDLLQGKANIDSFIQHTEFGDIISADESINRWRAGVEKVAPDALKKVLQSLDGKYDYVVLDTAPDKSFVSAAALIATERVIVVVQADMFSTTALKEFWTFFQQAKKAMNKDLVLDGILITRFSAKTKMAAQCKEIFEKAAAAFGSRIYTAPISESVTVREAAAEQVPLFKYSPRSKPAKEYASFVSEVLATSK